MGTKHAVRQALEEVRRIPVDREFATELPPLTADAERAVYRVAQESLTNVARDARAQRVTIALEPGADSVVVLVLDDRRQNILDKLGKRDRVELTRYAVRRRPDPAVGGGARVAAT